MKNKLIHIGTYALMLLALMFFLWSAQSRGIQEDVVLQIELTNPELGFVDKADVKSLLAENGYNFINTSLKDINVNELKEILESHSALKDVLVYKDVNGRVKIKVSQRTPILRAYNQKNQSYYIDSEGKKMYLSNKYTADVIPLRGNVVDIDSVVDYSVMVAGSNLDEAYAWAKRIAQDAFLNAQITDMYFETPTDLVMLTRLGLHKIEVGSIKDIDIKLKKLKAFYKEGLKTTEWNAFNVIKLDYKNQVVCEKR